MKTLNDFNFENKKALIRVDFNVPLNDSFEVTDATRIVSAKPTIIKILEDGGSCVLMSHLGRPKGVEEKKGCRRDVMVVLPEQINVLFTNKLYKPTLHLPSR